MSGTGLCFTGVIGVGGIPRPLTARTAQASTQDVDRALVTVTSPAGITEGDLMLFTAILVPHFAVFTARSIPASITLLTDPTTIGGSVTIVGYKHADAGDAAGTASYLFRATNAGGIGYARATITSFAAQYGTTPATAQVTTSTSPSITPTAGAGWYFVTGLAGRPTSTASDPPSFTMTSAGDLLLASTGGQPQVTTRLYSAPSTVDPITGSYVNSPNVPAMSVIGITA